MLQESLNLEPLDGWDPLSFEPDPDMVAAAQRREIRNILKSYTGYYDLFSELIQNSLDAVERRLSDEPRGYEPRIWIEIDLIDEQVTVTDNGCGMNETEFRQFLRPNFSFKKADFSRGNKGVGATYLAFGFNHLEVATRQGSQVLSGVLRDGRRWVEDPADTIPRPRVEPFRPENDSFARVDSGTLMRIKLLGGGVRPRDLSWIGAETAEQWLAILRTTTPLGGVYLCGEESSPIRATVTVRHQRGTTSEELRTSRYLYPFEVFQRVADIRTYLADQQSRAAKGQDITRISAKYRSLNGLWGEWTGDEILAGKGATPINARLEPNEMRLVHELGLKLHIFLAFSTDLWDDFNDNKLRLRKGHRLIRGGLQLCTRNMPQGLPLTIPMTNNIGFQNLAHVLVHFTNAEPDLGRKGFQPEVVRVAEKLAVSAVTALRKHNRLLRKPGGAKAYHDELTLERWKNDQITHEINYPLCITGAGLFLPTEELAIRSEPRVEQDVVALFNQMLTSGVVRGIHLLASSQYRQYDGLYRVKMERHPKFIHAKTNPLGIVEEHFMDQHTLETTVKILEYKYTVDGLIEELSTEEKSIEDIDLVIAWELGEKWREMFEVISYLDSDHRHLRNMHGTTHSFTHGMSGQHAFEAIILSDLVRYLHDPEAEERRQREKVATD